MADQLVVIEARGEDGFILAWSLDDGDEIGGFIGDENPSSEAILSNLGAAKKSGREDDVIHWLAYQACRSLPESSGVWHDSANGFVFPEKKLASSVLRQIKVELQAWRSGKPWPEWAKTAAAAGWKPPKNWHP